jgi:hypothetical protein
MCRALLWRNIQLALLLKVTFDGMIFDGHAGHFEVVAWGPERMAVRPRVFPTTKIPDIAQ